MTRVCLLVVGEPPPAIAGAFGRYPAWFAATPGGAELEEVDGVAGPALDPRDWSGIVISGSPASLTEPEPWMERAAELIRACAEIGTPVLGVCFGHQLAAAAFGGRVARCHRGWELGTRAIELTDAGDADPLFDGLPRRFEVNLSHTDEVVVSGGPPELVELARNEHALQALAIGEHIRGVQFHPEFDAAITRAQVEQRAGDLEDADAARAGARDTPLASRVIANFVTHFAARA